MRHSPLLSDDGREFADTVRRFAVKELVDPELATRDATGVFWREGWRRCASIGLCGLPAPTEFGGGGADRVTVAAALEALGYGCADAGLVFSLNAHLWSSVVPVWQFGTEEQQQRYLRGLCSGDLIGLHAMTEPESGSDAYSLTTVARRHDGGYVLKGTKALITNSPVADLFLIFARSPGSEGPLGVSAFLVESGQDGLQVGPPTDKLGLRTSPMGQVVLDDVRIGEDALLGREGRGARIFATSMEWERSLIMSSALGSLDRSLEEATAYARTRRQFGAAIGTFEAVADKLVEVRVQVDTVRPVHRMLPPSSCWPPAPCCRARSTCSTCTAATATPDSSRSSAVSGMRSAEGSTPARRT
jgi:alkylation response protein AidB-like acyl-CoA dehydrogenase